MFKLLLYLIISNIIYCEQNFILSVKETMMENINVNDPIPLIVKPTEDVSEEVEIKCNGNIRYNPPGVTWGYDLQDESPKTKIPAGTSAGTEIEFNCLVGDPLENTFITFILDLSMTDWSIDPLKQTIVFVPKYSANPAVSNSKNLNQNDNFNINIIIMSPVTTEVSIEDGTFIMENGDTTINLIQCDKIPINTQKGTITISCKVSGEVKDNKYTLALGEDKKIDGITPLVSGETTFSEEDKKSSSSNSKDEKSSSSKGKEEKSSSSKGKDEKSSSSNDTSNSKVESSSSSNDENSSSSDCNNLKLIWELMIIVLVLLF